MIGYSPSHTRTTVVRERAPVYRLNGGGRDTYIHYDNGGFHSHGGFATASAFHITHPKSTLPFLPRSTQASRNSPVESKRVNYRQDGSGRDTYIM